MKTKLNKKEVAEIYKIADRLERLAKKYDPEQNKDIELQVEGNGSIYSNINCALASLDTILQEYL